MASPRARARSASTGTTSAHVGHSRFTTATRPSRTGVTGTSTSARADDRHEAHAPSGRAAEVVRQPELGIRDLPRAGFAAELEPHLVHHAKPARADRVAEALQAAV